MSRLDCPYCGITLEIPSEPGDVAIHCPGCGSRVDADMPHAPRTEPGPVGVPDFLEPPASPSAASSISVPVLISAISNVIAALIWGLLTLMGGCCALPLPVALIVLCIFEFRLSSNAQTMPASQLASNAQTIGILEIVAGVMGNLVALVCGIIVLVNSNQVRAEAPARPPQPMDRPDPTDRQPD